MNCFRIINFNIPHDFFVHDFRNSKLQKFKVIHSETCGKLSKKSFGSKLMQQDLACQQACRHMHPTCQQQRGGECLLHFKTSYLGRRQCKHEF